MSGEQNHRRTNEVMDRLQAQRFQLKTLQVAALKLMLMLTLALISVISEQVSYRFRVAARLAIGLNLAFLFS